MKKTLAIIAIMISASGLVQAKSAEKALTIQPLQLKDKVYNIKYETAIGHKMSFTVGSEIQNSPSLAYVAGSIGLRRYFDSEYKGFYLGGNLCGVYADVNDYVYKGSVTTGWPEAELGYKWRLPLHLTADTGITAPLTDLSNTQLGLRLGFRW